MHVNIAFIFLILKEDECAGGKGIGNTDYT